MRASAASTQPRASQLQGYASQRGRPIVRAAAFGRPSHLSCPYEVLGLNPDTADEALIKRQYRKLAKQYHPDVAKDSKDTTPQFLNITQAYEFLLCQLRKDEHGNPRPGNSDAFHDWYWSFKMSRNWGRQQRARGGAAHAAAGATAEDAPHMGGIGGSTSPPRTSTPQSAEGLRSQLAGLRHRAAIKRQKASTQPTTSPTDATTPDARQPAQQEGAVQPQPQAAHEAGEAVFAAADGPSDSADPDVRCAAGLHAAAAGTAPQRSFVSNSNVREGLKEQLHGMRRKAALRREYTS